MHFVMRLASSSAMPDDRNVTAARTLSGQPFAIEIAGLASIRRTWDKNDQGCEGNAPSHYPAKAIDSTAPPSLLSIRIRAEKESHPACLPIGRFSITRPQNNPRPIFPTPYLRTQAKTLDNISYAERESLKARPKSGRRAEFPFSTKSQARSTMATEAQIAANHRNAQSSTVPRTEAGKSRAARNAVTFGIYSAGDFVRPEDSDLYDLFCESFQKSLRPKGALEQTLAAEVVHAAWRLRRCSALESELENDPLLDPADAPVQRTVDRARGEAQRQMLRATAELRRLQTDRQLRVECLPPDFDETKLGGLADIKTMQSTLAIKQKLDGADTMAQIIRATTPPRLTPQPTAETAGTKRTQSTPPEPAPIPRGAPCPCGSGQKYKRCCGQSAPAVLQTAA